jgi:hypothetical protein
VLLTASAVIAFYFGAPLLGSVFSATFLIWWVLSALQYSRLERYARPQIEAIAANEGAAQEVKEVFSAI